jgi:hypothetical protein
MLTNSNGPAWAKSGWSARTPGQLDLAIGMDGQQDIERTVAVGEGRSRLKSTAKLNAGSDRPG